MSTLKETLRELEYDEVMVADGFDDAAIGVVERCGRPPIVIYDYEKCARILCKRDKMRALDAYEYLNFNCVGAWNGEGTPGWLMVRLTKGRVSRG